MPTISSTSPPARPTSYASSLATPIQTNQYDEVEFVRLRKNTIEILEREKLTVVRISEEEKEKLRRRYTERKLGEEQDGYPNKCSKMERRVAAIMGNAEVKETQQEEDKQENNKDMDVATGEAEVGVVADETTAQEDDKKDEEAEKEEDGGKDGNNNKSELV